MIAVCLDMVAKDSYRSIPHFVYPRSTFLHHEPEIHRGCSCSVSTYNVILKSQFRSSTLYGADGWRRSIEIMQFLLVDLPLEIRRFQKQFYEHCRNHCYSITQLRRYHSWINGHSSIQSLYRSGGP